MVSKMVVLSRRALSQLQTHVAVFVLFCILVAIMYASNRPRRTTASPVPGKLHIASRFRHVDRLDSARSRGCARSVCNW